MKTWLITGCSSGLGYTLAKHVLTQGDNVVLTARHPEQLQQLSDQFPETSLVAKLDVTESDDISSVMNSTKARFGGLDVLVNNAGYGLIGAVEEAEPAEYRPLFEVNVFGLIEVTRAALPLLRNSKHGRVVNLSSTLGFLGRAGFGLYSAAKFAVEGLSEALLAEVEPLGIKVMIVEPGAFRTNFLDRSLSVAVNQLDVYRDTVGQVRTYPELNNGKQRGNPDKAAEMIIKAVKAEDTPLRLALGADSYANNRGKIERALADFDRWESEAGEAVWFAEGN